jgi:hypothetical protein
LSIAAPGQTLVYSVVGGIQQDGRVPDLFVGEHIAVKGTRTGKFTMSASAIHVYPRQHTVGGTVESMLPGAFRISGSDGKQYSIRVNGKTGYTLNGKPSLVRAIRLGSHIRVRGYDALQSSERGVYTIIAAHVRIIVHTTHAKASPTPKVKPAKTRKGTGSASVQGAPAAASATPVQHAA